MLAGLGGQAYLPARSLSFVVRNAGLSAENMVDWARKEGSGRDAVRYVVMRWDTLRCNDERRQSRTCQGSRAKSQIESQFKSEGEKQWKIQPWCKSSRQILTDGMDAAR